MAMIKVKDLSVRYRLDVGRKKGRVFDRKYQYVEALEKVTLDVYSGSSVGVIGPNGSGKSTLLKVLSGNLPPSSGEVDISGEVLSLLNRNFGLIRKASLRENARLKAYMLGLTGTEVNSFIDNCLLYSGLDNKADSPLNTLSTGMTGKFNLAMNSQIFKPITILDEWVGTLDVAQTASGGILGRLGRSADILLLASHNESLVRDLCSKVLLLDRGRQEYFGSDVDYAFQQLNRMKVAAVSISASRRESDTKAIRNGSDNDEVEKKELINIILHRKTGSYLIKSVLENSKSDGFNVAVHGLGVKLGDIPPDQKVAFFIRDPIERFSRAFYMRKMQGAPLYNSKWNQKERQAFARFKSANQLAEAIGSPNPSERAAAIWALNGIQHLMVGYGETLGSTSQVDERKQNVVFVGNSDNLVSELDRFCSRFGLTNNTSEVLTNEVKEHFSKKYSESISQQGIANLTHLFNDDIKFVNRLIETWSLDNFQCLPYIK